MEQNNLNLSCIGNLSGDCQWRDSHSMAHINQYNAIVFQHALSYNGPIANKQLTITLRNPIRCLQQSVVSYSTLQMKFLKKVLIANRGEISCRILRTAKRLNIATVAVFSDIDRHSLFVSQADEAYRIGTNPSSESYLNGDKIIEVAKACRAEGIHPGFGFLSENAGFADQCRREGIKFIGPPSQAIRQMGSKSESKKIMQAAGVSCVPGYHGQDQNVDVLVSEAKRIGFPVLIKAVSGGGGKGMRIVTKEQDFKEALEGCKREALKAFKDQRVLVEKYIVRPRHIQVQVFGDSFGNYVHLHERDCSVQRRHQKVVEEAPSRLPSEKREQLFNSAILAAKAVKYQNAGTVQFIFDLDQGRHYFMEMNTRLQVQHPISEMITGEDFVEWQLRVASGMPLPKTQQQVKARGHAFQARIYSENPYNHFLPANGKISLLVEPVQSKNVRVETGIRSGDEISTFYDPMIAKLVTFGEDRTTALLEMQKALDQYKVLGLVNNIPFLKQVVAHPEFKGGDYDTSFIAKNQKTLLQRRQLQTDDLLASLAVYLSQKPTGLPVQLSGFKNVKTSRKMKISSSAAFLQKQKISELVVQFQGQSSTVKLGDKQHHMSWKIGDGKVSVSLADRQLTREYFHLQESEVTVFDRESDPIVFKFQDDYYQKGKKQQLDEKKVSAPMPGTIVKICKTGPVKKGQVLVIMQAMKMEHVTRAHKDGVVKSVSAKDGQFVAAGDIIIELQ